MQSPTHVEQVGGSHYAGDYQHWDLVVENFVPYLEACATKYVSRWRNKDGVKDLLKAISYIDKRLVKRAPEPSDPFSHENDRTYRGFTAPPLKIMKWYKSAGIGPDEQAICWLILCWEKEDDLLEAKSRIEELIRSQGA